MTYISSLIVTLFYTPFTQPFYSPVFLLLFPPLSYLPPISSCSSLMPYQFSPASNILSWCEAPPTWTSPASAACQPPPLVPAPRTECLHLLPFLCRLAPTFAVLGLKPGPSLPLRFFAHHGSLCVSVSLPRPPQVLLRILASSSFGVRVRWIFAKSPEAKAPSLPGSHVRWSSPRDTWT